MTIEEAKKLGETPWRPLPKEVLQELMSSLQRILEKQGDPNSTDGWKADVDQDLLVVMTTAAVLVGNYVGMIQEWMAAFAMAKVSMTIEEMQEAINASGEAIRTGEASMKAHALSLWERLKKSREERGR